MTPVRLYPGEILRESTPLAADSSPAILEATVADAGVAVLSMTANGYIAHVLLTDPDRVDAAAAMLTRVAKAMRDARTAEQGLGATPRA